MPDRRDFVCTVCGCAYFWIKQWDQMAPGWYVLCGECKELYELLPDGTSKQWQYLMKN